MTNEPRPSFSPARKWSLSLNTLVVLVSVLALAVMINYLGERHFARFAWSSAIQVKLSPRTLQVLSLVTNDVKIVLYYDRREPLSDLSWSLLKAYSFANNHISIEAVDYPRDPGAAQVAKARYKLSDRDRDVVIFECQGQKRIVYHSELSDLDTRALMSGQGNEVRRTHFKGEMMFTSALLSVINPRQPKAYFLQRHGEHDVESDDGVSGYSKFGGVLRENAMQFDKLGIESASEIPADCNLLIIPGPRTALMPESLDKIDRYLKQGGRLLTLFNYPPRRTGLVPMLASWGVAVGNNIVVDPKAVVRQYDMVVATFGTHPLVKPFHRDYQLYLIQPRSISPESSGPTGANAPQVETLFYTTAGGIAWDLRADGTPQRTGGEIATNVPLAVAVEKGGVRNVSADRGSTRIVVVGDSYFLANDNIDRDANRQFASQAINWLLARNELLAGLAPRPIHEYKLTMTVSQEAAVRWILLLVMPGAVLLIGLLVWIRRRR
jgi:ABC-2 type transport system permease protein